jgi:hypothetical protein
MARGGSMKRGRSTGATRKRGPSHREGRERGAVAEGIGVSEWGREDWRIYNALHSGEDQHAGTARHGGTGRNPGV